MTEEPRWVNAGCKDGLCCIVTNGEKVVRLATPDDADDVAAMLNAMQAKCDKLRRWCEGMISGLQHVAELSDDSDRPTAELNIPDLQHHALGSLCDEYAECAEKVCIPAEFRKMFPDAKI